jgi:hypothetical protein
MCEIGRPINNQTFLSIEYSCRWFFIHASVLFLVESADFLACAVSEGKYQIAQKPDGTI